MLVGLKTLFLIAFLTISTAGTKTPPHIIFIMADDLGWGDVGFHGSNDVSTPNLDALAYSGVILQRYYVSPVCTPSRGALMTGKYPIHTGLQHYVILGGEPYCLPLDEKLLPQYLKELGYTTRMVGKWHLGSYLKECTPTFRGFDSHLGYWHGFTDYYDHTYSNGPMWGLDMRDNMRTAYELHGKYSTELLNDEAVRIIEDHNATVPLFLYLAHSAPHTGSTYNPLPVPDETTAKFDHIQPYERRKHIAMLSELDKSIGDVINTLDKRKMLENSIIIFSSDNGAASDGFLFGYGSNAPLRGVKNTLWEGAIRGTGVLWTKELPSERRGVSKALLHMTDWLPTLIRAAGGEVPTQKLDGFDQWDTILQGKKSPRHQILHNIDSLYGNAAVSAGEFKLMTGTTYAGKWDEWYGEYLPQQDYNIEAVLKSATAKALTRLGVNLTGPIVRNLRDAAQLQCKCHHCGNLECNLRNETYCLFNTYRDPCETQNVAKTNEVILKYMIKLLEKYNTTVVPPLNKPVVLKGDPKLTNYVWENFGNTM